MIPPDINARSQVIAETALRPLASAQAISDKLSDLIPGQRVTAEILTLLPNGAYRAVVAQRDVTLALPFSAKAGDTLELEVVDTDGKLTLAVLSRPANETAKTAGESVSTTLSRTGQLIGDLFSGARHAKGDAAALPLNGNQPIAKTPPSSAQELLPLLKQAITQSGMFYESHQAEWVGGRFDKAALLQEPQGRLSPEATTRMASSAQPGESSPSARQNAALPPAMTEMEANARMQALPAASTPAAQLVAPEAMPVVQLQLEALATQQFAWQGQVWPGQEMRWEIEEDGKHSNQAGEQYAGWQTRLHLTLPLLGEMEARLFVNGTQIQIDLSARQEDSRNLMRNSLNDLQHQLKEAGLTPGSIGISPLTPAAEPAGNEAPIRHDPANA